MVLVLAAFFSFGSPAQADIAAPLPPASIAALDFPVPPPPSGASTDPIGDVISELQSLPGSTSLRLERLEPAPAVLRELNGDRQMAIGSTFKLYILAALSEDRRPWEEVVRLKPELMSFPSGILHRGAPDSPMTVWGLAGLMVSLSDNTATDHLLHHAGRRRVEEVMALTGHSRPGRNRPMLSTLELFKLKADPAARTRFLAADEAGKRVLLETEVAALPRRVVEDNLADWTKPIAVDTAEWFASAGDLCRLLDHLRRRNDPAVLNIMSINPGLRVDEARYSYAGYKGGSEPGVINMAFLLRSRSGESFALSAAWNDPSAEIDQSRFFGLLQRVLDSIPSSSPVPAAGK